MRNSRKIIQGQQRGRDSKRDNVFTTPDPLLYTTKTPDPFNLSLSLFYPWFKPTQNLVELNSLFWFLCHHRRYEINEPIIELFY